MKLKAELTKIVGMPRLVQRKKALAELLKKTDAAGLSDLNVDGIVVVKTFNVDDVFGAADDSKYYKSHNRGINIKEEDALMILHKLYADHTQGHPVGELNEQAIAAAVDAWYQDENEEKDSDDEMNYRLRGIKPGCSCQNPNR